MRTPPEPPVLRAGTRDVLRKVLFPLLDVHVYRGSAGHSDPRRSFFKGFQNRSALATGPAGLGIIQFIQRFLRICAFLGIQRQSFSSSSPCSCSLNIGAAEGKLPSPRAFQRLFGIYQNSNAQHLPARAPPGSRERRSRAQRRYQQLLHSEITQ